MTDSVVAHRYAQALFSLGNKEGGGAREKHGVCLAELARMLAIQPKLAQTLKSPVIEISEKKAVLSELLKMLKADGTMRNFCFLLADKGRLGSLADIANSYGMMLDEANGVRRGKVITAIKLSPAMQANLKKELEKKAGGPMELVFAIDPEILGGMVLAVGDKVLDSSLRAQLGILRETLIRGM